MLNEKRSCRDIESGSELHPGQVEDQVMGSGQAGALLNRIGRSRLALAVRVTSRRHQLRLGIQQRRMSEDHRRSPAMFAPAGLAL